MNGRTMGEPPGAGKPADAAMAAAVERYGRFWAELQPDTTRELLALARPELLFKDPFNEIRGVDRVVALLDHMFASATEVRFEILRHAWSGDTPSSCRRVASRAKRQISAVAASLNWTGRKA